MTTAEMTTEVTPVTYVSPMNPDLVLVIEPDDPVRNHRGQIIDRESRVAVEFEQNKATIAVDERGRTTCNGKVLDIEFHSLIERLERHPKIGGKFRREEVVVLRPTLDELADAVDGANRDELQFLIASERKGHNRPEALALLSGAALALVPSPAEPTVEPDTPVAEAPVEEPDGDTGDVL